MSTTTSEPRRRTYADTPRMQPRRERALWLSEWPAPQVRSNLRLPAPAENWTMAIPNEFILADIKAKYGNRASSVTYTRLYPDDAEFGQMFAVVHEQLNDQFRAINGRLNSGRHYWAENSRALIALTKELSQDLFDLKKAGVEVRLADAYQQALEACEPWLSPGGGSTIPDDFEPIELIRHEPAFTRVTDTIKLEKQPDRLKMKMVGEGSYAHVYSYIDPDYGIKFAVKRAKRGIDERDLERFKQEFAIMKRLGFPYVVEVYRYDEKINEYCMEFCDESLRDYIGKRNSTLGFNSRKRIALQFLYGLNYLHSENLLHRDISLNNVLLKVYDRGAVLVKLSDFGLAKARGSDYTRTHTELRGTIRDPLLVSFKDYNEKNEIYAVGVVLSFIFTGRESAAERLE